MSETSNPKYVVIVNDSHTRQASLGERNYSDRHYTIIAAGKYEDIEPLARKLNAETPSVSVASKAADLNVYERRLAAMTPEEAARGVAEYIEKRKAAA